MPERPSEIERLKAQVAELEAERAELLDWAPIEEAAARTRQPVERLRTLKRRGQIDSQKRYGNRVYVRISSVVAQAKQRLLPR
jgi:hypothetical protein